MRNKVISVAVVIVLYIGVLAWCQSNIPVRVIVTTTEALALIGIVLMADLGVFLSLIYTIRWLVKG